MGRVRILQNDGFGLQDGKVKNEDVQSHTPIEFSMRLQGPTADFLLGRISESAIENALEKVFTTSDQINTGEIQKTIAGNEFRRRNCQLIGND